MIQPAKRVGYHTPTGDMGKFKAKLSGKRKKFLTGNQNGITLKGMLGTMAEEGTRPVTSQGEITAGNSRLALPAGKPMLALTADRPSSPALGASESRFHVAGGASAPRIVDRTVPGSFEAHLRENEAAGFAAARQRVMSKQFADTNGANHTGGGPRVFEAGSSGIKAL